MGLGRIGNGRRLPSIEREETKRLGPQGVGGQALEICRARAILGRVELYCRCGPRLCIGRDVSFELRLTGEGAGDYSYLVGIEVVRKTTVVLLSFAPSAVA